MYLIEQELRNQFAAATQTVDALLPIRTPWPRPWRM